MKGRSTKRLPLPAWFGPYRVLSDKEVLVRAGHTFFRLRNQPVVLGRGGLCLLAPLFIQEGSEVLLEVTGNANRLSLRATVRDTLWGLGTVFQFLPYGGGLRPLETLLAKDSTEKK